MQPDLQTDKSFHVPSYSDAHDEDDLAFQEEVDNLDRVEKSIRKVVEKCRRRVDRLRDDVYGYRPADIESRSNRMSSSSDLQRGEEQLEAYRRIALEPYFAHVDLKDDDDNAYELFVGMSAVYAEGKQVVVDWRSEMGSVYYNKQTTTPKVKNHDYSLLLRRGWLKSELQHCRDKRNICA